MWLIALVCLPGVGLIKLADRDHEAAGRVFGRTIPDGRRFVYVERRCAPVMAAIREYHAKLGGQEKERAQRHG